MSSGLQLPGSLSVTQSTLADVGTTMDVAVLSAVEEVARSSADGSASFTYYIQADYNINGAVSYSSSSSTDNLDDAYSMSAISVNSATATNAKLSLPAASGVTVSAGEVEAKNSSGTSLGTFPVVLTVSVDSVGRMTSSIAINGSDVTATESEDATKAQVVYWSGIDTVPTVSATDADVLSSTLTASELSTQYSSELATINGQYNGEDMVDSWTISVSAVSSSASNTLSQHARYLGKNGSTSLFSAGDKLVCATPFSYGVSINNYLGNATTIVTAANVYGVLQQTA